MCIILLFHSGEDPAGFVRKYIVHLHRSVLVGLSGQICEEWRKETVRKSLDSMRDARIIHESKEEEGRGRRRERERGDYYADSLSLHHQCQIRVVFESAAIHETLDR